MLHLVGRTAFLSACRLAVVAVFCDPPTATGFGASILSADIGELGPPLRTGRTTRTRDHLPHNAGHPLIGAIDVPYRRPDTTGLAHHDRIRGCPKVVRHPAMLDQPAIAVGTNVSR